MEGAAEDAVFQEKVASRNFLLEVLEKAEVEADIREDVADVCFMNGYTAWTLAGGDVEVNTVADKLFLTDDEAAYLVGVCQGEVAKASGRLVDCGIQKENEIRQDAQGKTEEGAKFELADAEMSSEIIKEERVAGNGTGGGNVEESVAGVVMEEKSSSGTKEGEQDKPSSPPECGPTPKTPGQSDDLGPDQKDVPPPPPIFLDDLMHQVKEANRELPHGRQHEDDAHSDATSPFVPRPSSFSGSPRQKSFYLSRKRGSVVSTPATPNRQSSSRGRVLAPDEGVGDSSDIHFEGRGDDFGASDDCKSDARRPAKASGSRSASPESVHNRTARGSDDRVSVESQSSTNQENFKGICRAETPGTSSTTAPESPEVSSPVVPPTPSVTAPEPQRPRIPPLRLGVNATVGGSQGLDVGDSVTTVVTTNSPLSEITGGTFQSPEPQRQPVQNGARRNRAAAQNSPVVRQRSESRGSLRGEYTGPSYLRPTVASEARRKAIEAARGGGGSHDRHHSSEGHHSPRVRKGYEIPAISIESHLLRPTQASKGWEQEKRNPMQDNLEPRQKNAHSIFRRPVTSSVLRPTQASLARAEASSSRKGDSPYGWRRCSSRESGMYGSGSRSRLNASPSSVRKPVTRPTLASKQTASTVQRKNSSPWN